MDFEGQERVPDRLGELKYPAKNSKKTPIANLWATVALSKTEMKIKRALCNRYYQTTDRRIDYPVRMTNDKAD